MKITSVEVEPLDLKPRAALTVAYGSYPVLEYALIKVHTDNGLIGLGEASPDPWVTGEDREGVVRALKDAGELLVGRDPMDISEIVDLCLDAIPAFPSGLAALDMAMYDLTGQFLGQPVYRLLGGKIRDSIGLYPVIPLDDPETMAFRAGEFAALGVDRIKVKLGSGPDEDLARVEAIERTIGDAVTLYLDINQGWGDAATAVRAVGMLKGFHIGWIEQPVKAEDLEGLAEVTARTDVPVMADEACHGPEDVLKIAGMKAANMINIKLMKCGGIYRAMKTLAVAEAAGLPCILGSMGESSIGSAAGLHVVMAGQGIVACELIGPLFIDNDPASGIPVDMASFRMMLPTRSGLGVELV